MTKSLEDRIADLEAMVAELQTLVRASPKVVHMTDKVSLNLVKDLPLLMADHPAGVGCAEVSRRYGCSGATTTQVLIKMAAAGKIQWVNRIGARSKVVLPIGQTEIPVAGSELRDRVLAAIIELAGDASRVQVSGAQIGAAVGTSGQVASYHVEALARTGRLVIARRGSRAGPAIYQIPGRAVPPAPAAPKPDPVASYQDSVQRLHAAPLREIAVIQSRPPVVRRGVRDVTAALMGDPPPGRTAWS